MIAEDEDLQRAGADALITVRDDREIAQTGYSSTVDTAGRTEPHHVVDPPNEARAWISRSRGDVLISFALAWMLPPSIILHHRPS